MSGHLAMLKIAGECPMGCGRTLFVGAGGHITCSWIRCPNPGKVDELLHDVETEHIVELGETSFSVQHPLRERGEDLFTCDMYQRLSELMGPPAQPGRYRVTNRSADPVSESYRSGATGLDFERIEETK